MRLVYSASLQEWYKNSEAGIEQGFEIAQRPFESSSGELVIAGAVDTDLSGEAVSRDSLVFSKDGREAFRYAGLKVVDATGRELSSWVSYHQGSSQAVLEIHADDSAAVYPISIDPVVATPSWSRDRKSTRLNSSHIPLSRMPSSA